MRVVHCKKEPFDVYIGRPSKWGNPFTHRKGTAAEHVLATRELAVKAFEDWIRTRPELMAALPELNGKTLGCWCLQTPVDTIRENPVCHGEVLMKLVAELE